MSTASIPRVPAAGTDRILAELVEQFLTGLQEGERIEASAFAAQHPEHSEALKELLPALEMMASLGVSRSQAKEGASACVGPATELGILGDYCILREVGRGGMGVVYEARQISLNRRVALKMLPFAAAMDQRQLQRFQNEAQAAAGLHHTNIVPVFSVGCERGVHYYAMQFIEGETLASVIRDLQKLEIKKASDGGEATASQLAEDLFAGAISPEEPRPAEPRPLERDPPPTRDVPRPTLATTPSTRSRAFFRTVAELGVQAAEALDYAHSLGVVHRDIKPANVLIDVRGNLWITDFGLARLQNEHGLTLTGDVIGTLRYMSPEQALGRRSAIDHRTDIYSLGVTLYELLVLRPAFESDDRQELLRQISAEEPRALRKLVAPIPRELETIVLKAIAKEPEGRYASAQDLADDLRRFLEDRPIRARRPTLVERAGKWTRRHATAVGAAALVLLIGVVGLAVSNRIIARRNAEIIRKSAEVVRQRDEIKRALKESEAAREQAEAVSSFLVYAFRRPDPSEDGRELKVADLLTSAAAKLDTEWTGSPRIKGELLTALGHTFYGLGFPTQAAEIHEKARAIRLATLGPDHPDTLTSRNNIALAYWAAGRTDEAITLDKATLKLRESRLGPDHPDTLQSRNNLANDYWSAGRAAEAIALHEGTLKLQVSKLGAADPEILQSRNNLAAAYSAAGRTAEAIAFHEGTLKLAESTLGPDHPDTLSCRNNLASTYWRVGRLDLSVPLFELTLKQRTSKLGPDHPETLRTQANLGVNYRDAGCPTEGARLMEDALRRARGRPDAMAVLAWLPTQLARAYDASGQFTRSEPLYRDELEKARESFGPEDPRTTGPMARLGMSLLNQEKGSEAEPLFRTCLTVFEKVQPDSWGTFNTRSLLGGALMGQGHYAEAEPMVVQGYEGMKAREATIPAAGKVRLTEAAERLVHLYEQWGRLDEAAAWKARLGLTVPDAKMPNGADAFAQ